LQGPRQILIQPWDRSYLESIGKAISQSNIGISPISDKDVIRSKKMLEKPYEDGVKKFGEKFKQILKKGT